MIPCRRPPIHRLPRKHDLILATALCLFAVPRLLTAAPLYGPQRYDRTTGPPNTYSASFEACNTQASYELLVQNGEGDKNRVSSASISLNGTEVVKESEFNQKVAEIRKPVTLAAENSLGVKLQSGPGGFITVSVSCKTGCLEVSISSPADGAAVQGANQMVDGTLANQSGETAVVLTIANSAGKGYTFAHVQGNTFAGLVPLQNGENRIEAEATDACGYTGTDEITLAGESIRKRIRLVLIPESGLSPVRVNFTGGPDLGLPGMPTMYSWDFDGDGTADESGAELTETTHTYETPGLFFPALTLSVVQGQTFTEKAVVNVLSRDQVEGQVIARWDRMKESLVAGEVEGALEHYLKSSRQRYRVLFTRLGENLPSFASRMRPIELISVEDDVAKARIKRSEDGSGDLSYYIYFMRDGKGIWKIRQF